MTENLNLTQYHKLVNLQRETAGATFLMGYSTKSHKHYIYFNNKPKTRFEDIDVNVVINKAIEWVLDKRVEQKSELRYTLFTNNKLH